MSNVLEVANPKQVLLFFIVSRIDQKVRSIVEEFVTALAASRTWAIGPPTFVDEIEQPEDQSQGDLPLETLGGYLEIYSALPPVELPPEIDGRHFQEVTALLESLGKLSFENSLDIEVELDGNAVGCISNGNMDRSLRIGLLDEWKRHLLARQDDSH
jgi:hypothetical protein